MVKGEKCFPMSDIESPLSNKTTDVNGVPTSYNTRVSYRNHTPGRLLSRIIDFNHFAACGNWLLSISIDISFCRLLLIIMKHNIIFVELRVIVMVAFHMTGTCLVINSCCMWCQSYLPCCFYESMIHWPLPLLHYRCSIGTEETKSYGEWWVRRYLLK